MQALRGKSKVDPIHVFVSICWWCICGLIFCSISFANDTGGSLSGEVRDPSSAVIPNVAVTLTNSGTGVVLTTLTNNAGSYYFASVPVGTYELAIAASGFRSYRRNAIAINVTSMVRADAVLELGENREMVTVAGTTVGLDTASTQMGEVLVSSTVDSLPLNGRSYSDLLALQAGVAPVTTMTSATVQGLGQSVFSPSGGLNPGVLSINGQRESANGYIVNGANAEENGSMAAAIIPNLDSIAEFRILVNNLDAEYGRYSGGQINVVTKSGSNTIHGDAFEFFRNTALDARNYFSPERGTFEQNQFGATMGGPIRRSKIFFFADYQGTKQRQGVDTGLIPVPSLMDRDGDLVDQAGSFATTATFNGATVSVPSTVSGTYFATQVLSPRLGYSVTQGEPYYFTNGENYIAVVNNTPILETYSHDCTSSAECVFPNATFPQSAWSGPAKALLQYIPKPSASDNEYSTSAFDQSLLDNKGAMRVDADTRWGRVSGYYALDNYSVDNPYPTTQGGANVPGFNAVSVGRSQLMVIESDKTIGVSAYNQFHISYTRVANDLGKPVGGMGVSLASQGFDTGTGTLGIVAGQPDSEGVENVVFNNFTIGSDPNQYRQINNTYEARDDFSRIWKTHTFKVGIHTDYDQINTYPYAQLNGSFQFYGTETGVDFADFLLGIASQYNQNGLRPFYERETYWGIYAQDSWRVRPNLTVNGGLRWDRIEPWWEKYNNSMTLVAGEQSIVFPTAPVGIVFPGDPGIPRTLAPAQNLNFAPRIGLAYSPSRNHDSLLGRIIGEPGTTTIHVGFGIFYTGVPGESLGLISDNAPYGFTYTSPAPPLFTTPFMDAATGHSEGQRFPAQLAPLNVSRENPDSNIDWAQFEPISAIPGYSPSNKTAYTEEYMLSWQRQIGARTLVTLTYAGNQAHRLLVLKAANPGNPAVCLGLSQANEVAVGSPTCGPFGESTGYTSASGETVNGTRGPLGPAFGSVSNQSGIGNSTYNSLKASMRYTSGQMDIFAGYTYSKSIDQASNLGDQVNPVNPSLSRGLSAFDMRHDFVLSYTAHLSVASLLNIPNCLGNGWSFSGITRFSTGFPVTLTNFGDTSLWGTQSNGINNLPVDEPSYQQGPLQLNRNPRNGRPYFNKALFTVPSLGDPGNARRRFFSGPGIDNYDMSLQKNLSLSESLSIVLRAEAFNVFNHAQFYGPQAINGNITDNSGNITDSSEFGHVVSAASPRLLQLAAKLVF
jgi:hypothetical protein